MSAHLRGKSILVVSKFIVEINKCTLWCIAVDRIWHPQHFWSTKCPNSPTHSFQVSFQVNKMYGIVNEYMWQVWQLRTRSWTLHGSHSKQCWCCTLAEYALQRPLLHTVKMWVVKCFISGREVSHKREKSWKHVEEQSSKFLQYLFWLYVGGFLA